MRFVETLESRQFLSVAPMGGAQVRAGAMAGAGDQTQLHDRDRLKDGSCQTASATVASSATVAKTQQQDRLRDGSCKL